MGKLPHPDEAHPSRMSILIPIKTENVAERGRANAVSRFDSKCGPQRGTHTGMRSQHDLEFDQAMQSGSQAGWRADSQIGCSTRRAEGRPTGIDSDERTGPSQPSRQGPRSKTSGRIYLHVQRRNIDGSLSSRDPLLSPLPLAVPVPPVPLERVGRPGPRRHFPHPLRPAAAGVAAAMTRCRLVIAAAAAVAAAAPGGWLDGGRRVPSR
jgi:hypothetical protein